MHCDHMHPALSFQSFLDKPNIYIPSNFKSSYCFINFCVQLAQPGGTSHCSMGHLPVATSQREIIFPLLAAINCLIHCFTAMKRHRDQGNS